MKIQWDEPFEFTRAVVDATTGQPSLASRALLGFGAAAVVGLLTLGFEWFFFFLHQKDLGVPAYFYIVAPTISALFIYYLPVMLMASRSTIVLTDRGVHRNKAIGSQMQLQLWPWDTITELSLEDLRLGDGVHRVLVVRSNQEPDDIVLGVGRVTPEAIEQAAMEKGVPLVNKTTASPAS